MKTSPILFFASSLLFTGAAFADAPPSGSVTIQDIDYAGEGCPSGSVATNISDDGKAMTVLFDDYFVESEGRPERKGCNLDVTLNAPPGWTFSLFCLDVRGYASLDENVIGKQSVEYSFGRRGHRHWGRGGRSLEVGGIKLEGPFDDDYENLTAIPLETVVWAPCGQTQERTLKIKTEIFIRPGGHGRQNRGGGLMTVDSVDGEMQHHYGLAWKRCSDQGGGGEVDYSGFITTKDMNLGPRLGQCSKTWKSTAAGELVVSADTCQSLLNQADRRIRRLLEQRINLWDRVVEREFEQWKRQRGLRGGDDNGRGGTGGWGGFGGFGR